MKRLIVLIAALAFLATGAEARIIFHEPDDPHCKAGEVALCFQGCYSTLLACGHLGTYVDGKFVPVSGIDDCNTTVCAWTCMCVPEPKEEGKTQ